MLVIHRNFGVADLHCSNVLPITGLLQNRSRLQIVAAVTVNSCSWDLQIWPPERALIDDADDTMTADQVLLVFRRDAPPLFLGASVAAVGMIAALFFAIRRKLDPVSSAASHRSSTTRQGPGFPTCQ